MAFVMTRIVAATAMLAVAACWGDDTITYRGETFQLSRRYSSYDSYKNDPNNLATRELARIRNLMVTAPAPRHFETIQAFSAATVGIKFPGYGWSFAERQVVGGPRVNVEEFEIPPGEEGRVLIWIHTKNGVDVLDDFVMKLDGVIHRIELRNGIAYYFSRRGLLLARRPFPAVNV